MRSDPPQAPSTVFVVAVCLAVVALVLGVGAIRFEFVYVGVTTDLAGADWVVDDAVLTPTDRSLVDAAIAGERYVTDSIGALPGPGRGSLVVRHDGAFHAFERRTYFDARTDYGIASLATALAGAAAFAVAVRSTKNRSSTRSFPL